MKKSAGFTLIELMIVIAVIAILIGIAVPAYNDQMRKSRRTEAKQILSDLQLKQEKWRSNNTTYATLAAPPTGIGTGGTTNYYTIALTAASNTATGYILTATPTGDQVGDSCGTLTLQMTAGVVTKLPSTGKCW